jgi:hypothetical protein
VERLASVEDGRVEISGRWFGVRGRRFVRPTLTLTFSPDGAERRWLADLAHKPWAAEDGEPWIAAFAVDVALDSASAIELSVAPDIEITLQPPGGAGAPGESSVAGQARSPLAKQSSPPRRPSARAQDLERLTARLASAQDAIERERERRATVEQALEGQRSQTRKLSAELGHARAELDLASTVQREGEAVSAELESTRRELRALQRRHQELASEHDRMIDAHASLESELRERSGALESARDALESARERAAEALAAERARAAETIEQEQARRADEVAAERRARTDELAAERRARAEELTAERARAAERLRTAKSRHPPAEILAEDADGANGDVDPAAAPQGSRGREDSRDQDRAYEVRVRGVGPQRIDRPVNPALRSRPNWLGRILALMVIIAVIVAVYLVLHSTILHH